MNDKTTSISKRALWHYVNKKINRSIHHMHVLSVISILFEEIIIDLRSGKPLEIFNFGVLSLKRSNPKMYYNVVYKKMMKSKGRNIMKFSLIPKIKTKISKEIDMEKTFNDE
jgi:nucleoid DNA-binding protein